MKKLNYYLMCLDSSKARTALKIIYYLSNVFMFLVLFCNLIALFNGFENPFTYSMAMAGMWAGLWLVYKVGFSVVKKRQEGNISQNEVLKQYILAFKNFKKELKIYYILGSSSFFGIFILAILLGIFESNKSVSIILVMLLIGVFIFAVIILVLADMKLINFDKDDARRKILQSRKEQLSKEGKEGSKMANMMAGIDKQFDYTFPLPEMKKRAKRLTNNYLLFMSLFTIVIGITFATIAIMSKTKNLINFGIIGFDIMMMSVSFSSFLLALKNNKFLKKNQDKMREFGDRYSLNLKYIEALEKNSENSKKRIFLLVPMWLSFIISFIGAIIGVQNKAGLILNIIAGAMLILSLIVISILVLKTVNEGSEEITNICKQIDEKEALIKAQLDASEQELATKINFENENFSQEQNEFNVQEDMKNSIIKEEIQPQSQTCKQEDLQSEIDMQENIQD